MADQSEIIGKITGMPTSVGTFFKSKSPGLAESLGNSSLDFLLVDRQHTTVSSETIESIIRAADLTGLPVMVRLATTENDFIGRILDAGARSLMIPQVEDPDSVRSVVDAARYDRSRSLSMGTHAGEFGTRDQEEYFEWVHNNLGIVPQIESKSAVGIANEIAELEGVTALMIGATDLALSLNVAKSDPKLQSAIDDVVQASRDAGCGVGIYTDSIEEVATYDQEMDYVVHKSDVGLLRNAIEQTWSRLPES